MFEKINRTAFPPKENSVMVWDGDCTFCRYWVTRWKSITNDKIDFVPYQQIASEFKDIPVKEFKKASRLIERDGKIYSGPDSVYRTYIYSKKNILPWHRWYTNYNWFNNLSDQVYHIITKHRGFFYSLTIVCFGKNPRKLKPYWLIYTLVLLALIFVLLKLL